MKKSKTPTRAEVFFDKQNLPRKVEFLKKHCGWDGGASLSITKAMKEIIYKQEVLDKTQNRMLR
jgi:hypothetical protein